jgi:PKD repeat protein
MRPILAVFLLLTCSVAYSQTVFVNENIQTDTHWDAEIVRVTGDIEVGPGALLTIAPGTQVVADEFVTILVYGTVQAIGSENDSIRFTSTTSAGWDGLSFIGGYESDSSIFEFCSFKNAYQVYWSGDDAGVLTIDGYSKFRVSHSLFAGNSGDAYSGGGALTIRSASSVVKHCRFKNNSANYSAGAVTVYWASPTISNCEFIGNQGSEGGAVYFYYSGGTFTRNVVIGNTALYSGGGGYFYNSETNNTYNVYARNVSATYGGGYAVHQNGAPIGENNTVAYNTSAYGGAGIFFSGLANLMISNCVLYQNTGQNQIYIENSYQSTFQYSSIDGGRNAIYSANFLRYQYNVETNPLFSDEARNDFSLSWSSFPTTDGTKSPCIDAGDPVATRDPDGSRRDLGALHFNQHGIDFAPYADFAADIVHGYRSLTVTFSEHCIVGSSPIETYLWDFGDGETSTDRNPVHTFGGEGKFTITLTITDAKGLTHAQTKENYITMHEGPYIMGDVFGTLGYDANTYILGGDITVPEGKKLIIEPGVKVTAQGHYRILVYGTLVADGTAEQPIIFTRADTVGFHARNNLEGAWGGIRIYLTTDSDSTILNFCKIQFVKSDEQGAIWIDGRNRLRISNSEISHNVGYYSGGGISCYSSGCLITDNLITSNYAGNTNSWYYGDGGGLYINGYANSPIVRRNFILNNGALNRGGGLFIQGVPTIVNNVISGNKAANGGGLFFGSSNRTRTSNNTIISNTATGSGGGVSLEYAYRVDFFNTILASNAPDNVKVYDTQTEIAFRNCLVRGGKESFSLPWAQSIFYYIGCIDASPKFAFGNNALGRIVKSSPARNAGYDDVFGLGVSSLDVAGNERVQDGRIDIGAYEHEPLPPVELLKPSLDVVAEEDFGVFRISTDSIFDYSLGKDWIKYDISVSGDNVTEFGMTEGILRVLSQPDAYGTQAFLLSASTGEDTVNCLVNVAVTPVNDPPFVKARLTPRILQANFRSEFFDLKNVFDDVDSDLSGRFSLSPNGVPEGLDVRMDGDFLTLTSEKDATAEGYISFYVDDGEFVLSDSMHILVEVPVGLDEPFAPQLALHPNPTTGAITINSPLPWALHSVNDARGRAQQVTIEKRSDNEGFIDLAPLSPGLYILTITTGRGKSILKVLKF